MLLNKCIVFLLFVVVCTQMACNTSDKDACATDFDQLAMLEHYGNAIIVPAYEQWSANGTALQAATTAFESNPTISTLEDLKTAFVSNRLMWQEVAVFDFGPAETENVVAQIDNYPVFVSRLESALDSPLTLANLQLDYYSFTRGFAAVDYLLYGIGATPNDVLAKYTTDAKATARLNYLKLLVEHINYYCQALKQQWTASNTGYLATFTTTEGVANGSPISNLINGLNKNYERIKNMKVGVPIGAKTGYVTNENNVEALYSGLSLDLIIAALRTSKLVFEGDAGLGLDDYLAKADAKRDDQPLQTIISNQYQQTIDLFSAIAPASWKNAVLTNSTATQAAYASAQNQVVFLKTDLPSALCVSIVYVDNVNDGD